MALIVKIGANMANFDKEMKKLTRDVNKVGDKLKNAGATLSAAITLPVIALGAAATKTGMEFEAQMSRVGAIAGATADEMDALNESAKKLGAETSKSASEVAVAMEDMAAMGFNAMEIIGAMPGVISASEASGESLALAAQTVAAALNIWGLEASEASRVADVLAMAANTSAAGIEDMQLAFKYAGAPAAALGIEMEDVAAAIGIMTDAGLDGSNAGTSLRASLLALNNPAKAQQKMMDELGISMRDNEGNALSLSDMIGELIKSTEGMTEADKVATLGKLVGTEAVSGFLSLMKAGPTEIDKLSDSLRNSVGVSAETAAKMKDNLKGALEELGGTLETVGITIYNNLKPALESIVSAVQGLAEWFNNLSPSTQNLIIGLAGLAAAIGPLLVIVGTGIVLFGQLKAALAILQISFMSLAWPILAVIAALAAIVAVVVYWDEIKEFFTKLWNYLKELFFASVEYIRDVFQGLYEKAKPILDAIGNALSTAWNFIKTVTTSVFGYISSYIKAIWDAIWFFIGPTVMKIVDKITENWNKAKAITSTVLNAMKAVVSTVFNTIKNTTSDVWTKLVDIISVPVGLIKDKVSTAFEGMKSTVLGVWEGIKTGLKVVINGIIHLINKFIGKFNGPAKLLNKIPGVNAPIIPNIPMLATGGTVFGSGKAIVGEAGPELLQKSGSSVRVTPLSSQEKNNGIGGALEFNNENQPIYLVMDNRVVAEILAEDIKEINEFNSGRMELFRGGYA